MGRTNESRLLAASTLLAALSAACPGALADTAVSRLEVASFGNADALGLQGNFDSTTPAFSARTSSRDGRHAGFVSLAGNLVVGDSNASADVFVRDRHLGITTRESVGAGGVQANAASANPSLSADGQLVAFDSDASNLVASDNNAQKDVFVRDRVLGITSRVSVDSAGAQGNGISQQPTLSADGRYVAFLSTSSNLVTGDSNGVSDIFVRDRNLGITSRVSLSSTGVQGNGASATPIISIDGRYVAFYSWANNLVAGDGNSQPDVFLHDRQTATTTLVSVSSAGVQGNAGSFSPALSADGRWIAFESNASNLVGGDSNGVSDVFLRDVASNTTTRISVDSLGQQANGASARCSMSEDGNRIVFDSAASNLVIGDANGVVDVFVRNRSLNTTVHASYNSAGLQANNTSRNAAISGDGNSIVYQSDATNLVANDSNAHADAFVFDLAHAVTTRISVASDIAANQDSFLRPTQCCANQLSGDGRRVAFESRASNLVLGDSNSVPDVFVFDRIAASPVRVSVSSAGAQGNAASSQAALAAGGQYAAFESLASNLVASDSNGVSDVFVHNLATHASERVSVDSAGLQGNAASSKPSLSADGRQVAFESSASNLVPGDSNARLDVFVRDRVIGSTQRASVDSAGAQGFGNSSDARISDNGRYVAFASSSTTLVAGDSNGVVDIFVRDLQLGTTSRVSVDSLGNQANGASGNPAISADGRFVAFQSAASNLVAGDSNAVPDIFVHDRMGPTTRVSLSTDGIQANGFSSAVAISADGRFVAFQSQASNLVAGDGNGTDDIFLRDRLLGQTLLVSMDRTGTLGLDRSELPSLAADGSVIAFQSTSGNWTVDAGIDHPSGPSGAGYDVFVAEAPVQILFRDGFE